MALRVEPATPHRWHDIVQVFGRRGDDPSWCWCRRFLRDATDDHRAALQAEVRDATVPPGVVAYVDEHPVGWSRVGPRAGFPAVQGNRALAKVLPDDPRAWWVTCFVVDGAHRRSGVGAALLDAVVSFAREHGASAIEGHPVDVAGLAAAKVSGSALFTGTLAMFAGAGFHEIGRTYATRPVMRRELSARQK